MNTYCSEKKLKTKVLANKKVLKKRSNALLLTALIIFSAALIVRKDSVTFATVSACKICLTALIPALYPFMVISGILTRAFPLGNKPLLSAFFVGNLFGFPLGAKLLSDLYESGDITKEQYRNFLPLCSNPGLAFTIVGVGLNQWNSYAVGALIYLVTLVSAIASFLVISQKSSAFIEPRTRVLQKSSENFPSYASFGKTFAEALSSGTENMLKVCGSVIFFAALSAVFKDIAACFELPRVISAVFYSFLELSGATAELSGLSAENAPLFLALTFFAHGFGGLCVCAQISAVAKNSEAHIKCYLLFKLLQACISFLLAIPISVLNGIF